MKSVARIEDEFLPTRQSKIIQIYSTIKAANRPKTMMLKVGRAVAAAPVNSEGLVGTGGEAVPDGGAW